MNATKNILYQEGATFEFDGERFFPVKSTYRPSYNDDFVYVEVRQYISDDGVEEVIISKEVYVDRKPVVDSRKVLEKSFNTADHVRFGITEFDSLLASHPANGARLAKEGEDELPF